MPNFTQCPNCGSQLQQQMAHNYPPQAGYPPQGAYPPPPGHPPQYPGYQQQQPTIIIQNTQQSAGGGYGADPFFSQSDSTRSNGVMLVLVIFLGVIGIHRFYAGRTGSAVVMLILGIVSVGIITSIWAFIDFIIILCGSFQDGDGRKISW
jgi:TM2 domain-containing membrane protein YozV